MEDSTRSSSNVRRQVFRVKSRVDTDWVIASVPNGIVIPRFRTEPRRIHVVRMKFYNLFVLDKHRMHMVIVFTRMLSRYVRCIPTVIKKAVFPDLFPPTIRPLIYPTGIFPRRRILLLGNGNRRDRSSEYKENQGVQE